LEAVPVSHYDQQSITFCETTAGMASCCDHAFYFVRLRIQIMNGCHAVGDIISAVPRNTCGSGETETSRII
jgi:hypothetical protein